jgi:hypothetical protein
MVVLVTFVVVPPIPVQCRLRAMVVVLSVGNALIAILPANIIRQVLMTVIALPVMVVRGLKLELVPVHKIPVAELAPMDAPRHINALTGAVLQALRREAIVIME